MLTVKNSPSSTTTYMQDLVVTLPEVRMLQRLLGRAPPGRVPRERGVQQRDSTCPDTGPEHLGHVDMTVSLIQAAQFPARGSVNPTLHAPPKKPMDSQ